MSSTPANAFALFDLPIDLWPDLEKLKALYLKKNSEIHPDLFQDPQEKARTTEQLAELNRAYRLLQDVRTRLHHCIELTTGTPSQGVQSVPAHSIDLFMKAGSLIQQLNAFFKSWENSSVIEKAGLMEEQLGLIDSLQEIQQELSIKTQQIEQELQLLRGNPLEPLIPQLKEHEALLSYIQRMNQQLSEYQNRFEI